MSQYEQLNIVNYSGSDEGGGGGQIASFQWESNAAHFVKYLYMYL